MLSVPEGVNLPSRRAGGRSALEVTIEVHRTGEPRVSDDPLQSSIEFHAAIREQIRHADEKAAIIFAASAVVMSLPFADLGGFREMVVDASREPGTHWSVVVGFGLVAFIGLLVAIMSSALCLWPRFDGPPSWLCFRDILEHSEDATHYAKRAVTELNSHRKQSAALLRHAYALARICKHKFLWVRYAVAGLAVASIALSMAMGLIMVATITSP